MIFLIAYQETFVGLIRISECSTWNLFFKIPNERSIVHRVDLCALLNLICKMKQNIGALLKRTCCKKTLYPSTGSLYGMKRNGVLE
jgi:hypothetical protein